MKAGFGGFGTSFCNHRPPRCVLRAISSTVDICFYCAKILVNEEQDSISLCSDMPVESQHISILFSERIAHSGSFGITASSPKL